MALRNYEGLFLLDSSQADQVDAVKQELDHLIVRRGGEIVFRRSWGERRLVYEISKQKKGYYELLFFKLDPGEVDELRRDLELSDHVIRNLILVHEEPRFAALIEKAKIEEVRPPELSVPPEVDSDRPPRKPRFEEFEFDAEEEGARSAGEAVS